MNIHQPQMKSLRLLMPQWQGGKDESPFPGQIYPMGAIPAKEGGVFWRKEILQQMCAARNIIDAYRPDRIITFGGDCLVNQAPFSYLNERYDG